MSIPENARVHVPMLDTQFSRNYYNWIMEVFEFMSTATRAKHHPGFDLPHNVQQVKITVTQSGKWFLYTFPDVAPSSISDRLKMRKLEINRKSKRPVSISDMKTTVEYFQSRNNFSADVVPSRWPNSYFFTFERKF